MDVVYSVNGVPIRLTAERWLHIVEHHDDLAGYYDEILGTIEMPDFIIRGYGKALVAVKILGKRYLLVVYKEVDEDDGFVITSYFTDKVNEEEIIWRK